MLLVRSEQCQNTKFSKSRHWKWPRFADDDLPLSSKKNQQAKTKSSLTTKNWEIPMCWKPSKLWWAGSLHHSPLLIMTMQTGIQWSPISTQMWLKQPVRTWQTSSEEKTLDTCRTSWSVQQKERTEKEKIRAWRSCEIQGSEQQQQEKHEKG